MTTTKRIARIGLWSGLTAFTAVLAFDVVQILQIIGMLSFPLDEILIYGTSLCIVIPFLILMLAFHYLTPESERFWSHAAVLFAVIYAVFVTANYVVQLVTVIPAKISGSIEAVKVLDQTPHSLFWNFDAIGYIAMGLAALMAIPALDRNGFDKWVRISLWAHGLMTPVITFVYFYPTFSQGLLLVGLPWAFTAPLFMIMLAFSLAKKG